MSTHHSSVYGLPLLLVAWAGGPLAAGAQANRIVVPLTDPSRPAKLEVVLLTGDISVMAYDGDEVIIVTDEPLDDRDDDSPRADGLRRISGPSMGLTVEESANTVALRMDMPPRSVDLEISVPRRTSVALRTVNGGDVRVSGVTGEHELSNVNGDVVATDISGSAVVATTNGDVEVTFVDIAADKAMSFSSFNGDVDVTLPASLSAELRMSSGRGDVLTDFDVEVQPQAPVVEQRGDGGRYQVRMTRDLRATVGRGGPEIQFRTGNGDIMIRKR